MRQALRVRLARKGLRALQVNRVRQGHRDLKVSSGHKAFRASRAHKAPKGSRAHKGLKVQLVLLQTILMGPQTLIHLVLVMVLFYNIIQVPKNGLQEIH